MIGIDQEPSEQTQTELKRLFGDGKYALRYSEQGGGTVVASITMYGEQAPKLLVHLATNATRPQVDAVWSEALQRYRKDHAHELAHASGERPADAVEDRAEVDSPNAPPATPAPTAPTEPAPDLQQPRPDAPAQPPAQPSSR